MHNRMLRYYSDLRFLYENLKINQFVIYIGKATLFMKNKIVDDRMDFRYTIIDMHKIDCEKFINLDTPDAFSFKCFM